jgi:hypothetical protein
MPHRMPSAQELRALALFKAAFLPHQNHGQ